MAPKARSPPSGAMAPAARAADPERAAAVAKARAARAAEELRGGLLDLERKPKPRGGAWRSLRLAVALALALAAGLNWLRERRGTPLDVRAGEEHPISRWAANGSHAHFLVLQQADAEVRPAWSPFSRAWLGTWVSGSVRWPRSDWHAAFNVLPSLISAEEARAMKELLVNAPEDFDEDIDGVDKMVTYEFIISSIGAAKSKDPPRESLRRKLLEITLPIIRSRIEPFVRERYPKARSVCHSMIRRYLRNERRTHNTHWDIPSYVSVVVSLDSAGDEFDGGFFVTTGTGLNSFIPLQRGDTVIHQSDLLHGVHVRSGDRWSWAMWFQDSRDCSSEPADWWKEEAEKGDAVAQTLRGMRARTPQESRRWLGAAAAAGFPRAQLHFARAWEDGTAGPKKDLQEAALWYSRAREAGELDANYYLGMLERARENATGATQLFLEGAQWGDPYSMAELSALYQQGSEFTPRSLDVATQWCERASDFDVEAMYRCYELYSQPSESRGANLEAASLFLERAARMGHEQAKLKFVEPMMRAKRWQEAVPWLLRIESKSSMKLFVDLYSSGVPVKPFALFRGKQLLKELAENGYSDANDLLKRLISAKKRRKEL